MSGVLKNLLVDHHTFRSKRRIPSNISERSGEASSIWLESTLRHFFTGYALYTGRSWKGNLLVAHCEELHENDASDVCFQKKQVLVPKEGDNFHIPMCKMVP